MSNQTKISLLLTTGYLLLAGVASAAPISSVGVDRHAWNNVVGWIDFGGAGAVDVSDAQLSGYANSLQTGPVALDCATTPNGNICAVSDFKVSNDGSGNLSGWAWNDNIGWISFDNLSVGSSYGYQVKIDGSTGDFSGWAWNDVVGWISFNCVNFGPGSCNATPPPDAKYKVNTSWRSGPDVPLPAGDGPTGIGPGGSGGGGGGGTSFEAGTYLTSSIFDTQVKGGAALNTVMWLGDQPAGTSVGIKIASSNSTSGPWDDANFLGPDGKSTSVYEANQGVQFRLNPNDHNNKRYFRYQVYLYWVSDKTPTVEDVVISYSP